MDESKALARVRKGALDSQHTGGKRRRASTADETSPLRRVSTRRETFTVSEDGSDLDEGPIQDVQGSKRLRKNLRNLSKDLQKTPASDFWAASTAGTGTDSAKESYDSIWIPDFGHEPVWLVHLLAVFNCDSVPTILFSRASIPSKKWNNDGELMQVELNCFNSIYPSFKDISQDWSVEWLQCYTSNFERKQLLADLIDSEHSAMQEFEVSSNEIQLRILIMAVSAMPDPWCEIAWEAVEEELWGVVESTCLPLLGVISMDEIIDFFSKNLNDDKVSIIFTMLRFLLRLSLLLKRRTPQNISTLISQGFDLFDKSQMKELMLPDIEYLRLLKAITDILSMPDEDSHVLARYLKALDHGGSMRSNAAIGFALGSLHPHWIVSASQSEKDELLNWRPISPAAPSTMEVLAQAQLLGAISLKDLPSFMWVPLSLETKVLIAFCEATKKAFANAAEILDQHIKEVEVHYGPKSLELLLVGTVLINCWNATGREIDGERLGRLVWSNIFGDFNVDATVEVTNQIFLMVAISDSFLGQSKFDEAKRILNAVLDSPETDNDLAMSATLRVLKINRRLRDHASLFDDWLRLQKAVQNFHCISDTLKYECIEETICLLSNLEPKDIPQFPQVPEVVKILSRYRIESYQGSTASKVNLLQNLEELNRFKSKLNLFSISGPELFYCRKMRERFPSATVPFVEKVASVNWHRSKRINEIREKPQEVEENPEFKDSALGSSIGTDPMAVESSRNRPEKARSITTIDSSMPHEEGATLLPPIPTETPTGERICFICEKPLKGVKNESQWRRHAFADLRPYICIVEDCNADHMNFANRTEFAAHLREHQQARAWACTHCGHADENRYLVEIHIASTHTGLGNEKGLVEKTLLRDLSKQPCPFCNEIPGVMKFVGHLCHHLEEISLTAVPRDIEMDEDDDGNSTKYSADSEESTFLKIHGTLNAAVPLPADFNSTPTMFAKDTHLRIDFAEEEPYTIKCICDFDDDDGNTIYCETCDTWQHIECYYPGRADDASREEFDHSCVDCKPRSLNRRAALERRRNRRNQKQEREKALNDLSKRLSTLQSEREKEDRIGSALRRGREDEVRIIGSLQEPNPHLPIPVITPAPSNSLGRPTVDTNMSLRKETTFYSPSTPKHERPHHFEAPPLPRRSQASFNREVTKGEDGKYVCTWVGCTEGVRVFTRMADWTKHMDTHDRPYKCTFDICKDLLGFSSSSGLVQHGQEVHRVDSDPTMEFDFSYPNYEGSSEGFSGGEDLYEHLRSVHKERDY